MKGQPLFPELRVLSISLSDILQNRNSCYDVARLVKEIDLEDLHSFLAPTLAHVNITGHHHPVCFLQHALVDTLSVTNSHLHHLRLEDTPDLELLQLIPRFQYLQVLDFNFNDTHFRRRPLYTPSPIVYVEIMKVVSSSSSISSLLLSMELLEPVLFPSISSPAFSPALSVLRLSMKLQQPSSILTIFPLLPNLESLRIWTAEHSLEVMKELGTAICSCPLLRSLEINADFMSPTTTIAAVDYVRPFKGLMLQALVLDILGYIHVKISSGALREIGCAFPKLRKLHLFPSAVASPVTFSTVNAGIAMFRTCSDLVDFRLSGSVAGRQSPTTLAPFPTETTFHPPPR
jgi:hypothetical protein